MTPLATWLRARMAERGLTQTALCERAAAGAGTIRDVLLRGHIPKVEILFRLAAALDTSPVAILLVSDHLRRGDTRPGAPTAPPDQRPDALAEFTTFARALKRPRCHLVGDESEAGPHAPRQ